MKTIYECSQSKGIKWFTAIFILFMIIGVMTEMYFVSKGMNVTGAIIVSSILLVVAFSCFLIFPIYIVTIRMQPAFQPHFIAVPLRPKKRKCST